MLIRVAIVEDDTELRETVQGILNRTAGLACCGAYGDPREAVKRLPLERPDVVLMDIKMPGMTGIECVARLKAAAPSIKAIMLTVYEESDQVFESLAAGALGYLAKSAPLSRVLDAIREVHAGGSPMSAHIARMVVERFQNPSPKDPHAELSARERVVLQHLARGRTYEHIAGEMGVSVSTVRTYITRIYEKLQVHSRTEAVAKYLTGARP